MNLIPYVTIGAIDIFGLEIRPFFLLVVTGVIAGVYVYDRICSKGGLIDRRVALHTPEVCLIGGFIGAHLVHVFFYHPEQLSGDTLVIFKIWGGFSSVGGFLGGTAAGIAYLRWKRQALLSYGDRLLFGFSVGWIFGRTGCATVHDHPGRLTDFPLAVDFPGGARHDMGLYELVVTVVMVAVLAFVSRRPRRRGTVVTIILLFYSPIRFGLDFLRATDVMFADARFWGLTPAQYVMVPMFLAGIYLLATSRKRPMDIALIGSSAAGKKGGVRNAE